MWRRVSLRLNAASKYRRSSSASAGDVTVFAISSCNKSRYRCRSRCAATFTAPSLAPRRAASSAQGVPRPPKIGGQALLPLGPLTLDGARGYAGSQQSQRQGTRKIPFEAENYQLATHRRVKRNVGTQSVTYGFSKTR
jgi:hypothetical protein